MQQIDLGAELARFDPELSIARAWTPPSSWYTAQSFFELEQRTVIAGSWQPVAHVTDFAAPGDYVSGCLAGEPWVVVRTEKGELRAFHNTCRHKGREVVQGRGCAHELVCGYHAWKYDLEGQLRSAPRMAGIEDFDRGAMALPSIALECFGPWVMLNLDRQATPLADRLGPLTERLEATDWQGLRFVDRRVWDIECNWKVYVDNYLDGGYHIPHMHPSLDAQLDMSSYRTDLFADYSIQSSPPAGTPDESLSYDAAARIGAEAMYIWLYPNFMLNRYGPCLDTNYVLPLGPDRCQVHYEFFFRETEGAVARAFVDESIAQAGVTQKEDIAICESVQVGLRSRGYERGRYAPQVEAGELQFHRLLHSQLQTGLARSQPR